MKPAHAAWAQASSLVLKEKEKEKENEDAASVIPAPTPSCLGVKRPSNACKETYYCQ